MQCLSLHLALFSSLSPTPLYIRIYGLKYCPAHSLLKHRKYVYVFFP
jgi:hypothetical protein